MRRTTHLIVQHAFYLHYIRPFEFPIRTPHRRNSEFTANTTTTTPRHQHHFCIFEAQQRNDSERRTHNKINCTINSKAHHKDRPPNYIARGKRNIVREAWHGTLENPRWAMPCRRGCIPVRPVAGPSLADEVPSPLSRGSWDAFGSAFSRVRIGEAGQSA